MRDAACLQAADLKIAALTLELAHHKRLRFANKSEAFSPEQRELFQECWNTDLAAMEAEVEQQAAAISSKHTSAAHRTPARTSIRHAGATLHLRPMRQCPRQDRRG